MAVHAFIYFITQTWMYVVKKNPNLYLYPYAVKYIFTLSL